MVTLVTLSLLSLALSQQQEMNLVLLKDAPEQFGAMCLDGTPPGFYFYPGSGEGTRKWYLYHEGGGWCSNLRDCFLRAHGANGSTIYRNQTMGLPEGYFSTDKWANPMMHNWNKVLFIYCDGGSFAGNNATVAKYAGQDLYFRGFPILRAFLHEFSKRGLLEAEDVVISGCSAGGLATYLHLDWWADSLPDVKRVRGLADSGFFLDYDSDNGPKFGSDMRWTFLEMNGTAGVNQDCIAANPKSPELCFFAEHTGPYIKTPIFPLQSRYDAWQTDNILGSTDPVQINKFGELLFSRFKNSVFRNYENGAFFDSCHHHCGQWDEIRIGGKLSSKGFDEWFHSGKGIYIQDRKYPCKECCYDALDGEFVYY